MKKFILYSTGITLVVFVVGILFVLGIFDFGEMKENYVYAQANSALDTHNAIVELVNDIGVQTKEMNGLFYQHPLDAEYIKKEIARLTGSKEKLVLVVQEDDIHGRKQEIGEEFNNIYLPKLIQLEKFYTDTATQIENATEEAPFALDTDAHKKAFYGFVEAHNEYTDTLNDNRRY